MENETIDDTQHDLEQILYDFEPSGKLRADTKRLCELLKGAATREAVVAFLKAIRPKYEDKRLRSAKAQRAAAVAELYQRNYGHLRELVEAQSDLDVGAIEGLCKGVARYLEDYPKTWPLDDQHFMKWLRSRVDPHRAAKFAAIWLNTKVQGCVRASIWKILGSSDGLGDLPLAAEEIESDTCEWLLDHLEEYLEDCEPTAKDSTRLWEVAKNQAMAWKQEQVRARPHWDEEKQQLTLPRLDRDIDVERFGSNDMRDIDVERFGSNDMRGM